MQTLVRTQQHRVAPIVQFRALDDTTGRFAARVLNYNVIDDYRTEFAPGVFTDSLLMRMPRIVWGHDWTDPIGRWVDYEDGPDHLDLIGEFDDFDAVPRARQAYAQLKSGTIDQFSVGFMPEDGEETLVDGEYVFRFTKARLDEVSLVLVGAVPGTALLAVRNAKPLMVRDAPTITKDFAAQVVLDLHSGKIDLADALQSIKAASPVTDTETPESEPDASEEESEPETETPEEEPETDPEPEIETPEADFSDLADVDTLLDELTLV